MLRDPSGRWFGAAAATVLVLGAVIVLFGGSPAGATDVGGEAGLRAAFGADGQIDLLNDITLTDCSGGDLNRSATGPVTIDGHGFAITQTCSDNILESNQGDVTIRNLTLTGGRDSDDGGAIDMNGGDLTVIGSTLVGNCSGDSAGAIENEDGSTTIIGSTLTGNQAVDQAGAVRSKRGDTVIVNSTVTGNSQATAGAVDSGQTDVTPASLTLVYSTIVENTIDTGISCGVGDEGAQQEGGPPVVANVNAVGAFASFGTVVALPGGAPNCAVANPGSAGQNFSDDASCGFTGTGDTENGGDPLLGPLANNEGPTQTRLPQTGSPLIDAISLSACGGGNALAGFAVTSDQRDVSRPQGVGCDIGAVEVEDESPPPPPPPPAAEPVAATPVFTG